MLVHPVLHSVWPLGQVHAPPTQVAPVTQLFPQVPQLVRSFVRSEQRKPQSVRPPAQRQLPEKHSRWEAHTLLHAPQWFRSLVWSTQTPEQGAEPSLQRQTPLMHA